MIAIENETSSQVISNAITRLRKLGLLEKNIINKKLSPMNKDNASITLLLTVVPPAPVATSAPAESVITSNVNVAVS